MLVSEQLLLKVNKLMHKGVSDKKPQKQNTCLPLKGAILSLAIIAYYYLLICNSACYRSLCVSRSNLLGFVKFFHLHLLLLRKTCIYLSKNKGKPDFSVQPFSWPAIACPLLSCIASSTTCHASLVFLFY